MSCSVWLKIQRCWQVIFCSRWHLRSLGSRLFDQSAAVDQGIVLKQMQILATASSKMVCGQVLDLQSEGKQVDQATWKYIDRNKTGALISAAVMMAAVTVFDGRDKAIPQLREYAQAIGLAFQVQDDILDIISDTEVLGKTAGRGCKKLKDRPILHLWA